MSADDLPPLDAKDLTPRPLNDLTPPHLRCSYGTCPAVLDLGGDDVLIIGNRLSPDQERLVKDRVGETEAGIVINRKYLANLSVDSGN